MGISWAIKRDQSRIAIAVQVILLQHGIRPHGGMDRRVLAVPLHEEVGGAVDVEDGDHHLMQDRVYPQLGPSR